MKSQARAVRLQSALTMKTHRRKRLRLTARQKKLMFRSLCFRVWFLTMTNSKMLRFQTARLSMTVQEQSLPVLLFRVCKTALILTRMKWKSLIMLKSQQTQPILNFQQQWQLQWMIFSTMLIFQRLTIRLTSLRILLMNSKTPQNSLLTVLHSFMTVSAHFLTSQAHSLKVLTSFMTVQNR